MNSANIETRKGIITRPKNATKRKRRRIRKLRVALFLVIVTLLMFFCVKIITTVADFIAPNDKIQKNEHSENKIVLTEKKMPENKISNEDSESKLENEFNKYESNQDNIQTIKKNGVYSITMDTPLHGVRFASKEAIAIFLQDKGVLEGLEEVYYQAGGANQIPAGLLAAMAAHETGKGTSYVAREFNNLGGMICNSKAGKRIYNGCDTMPNGQNLWQKYNLKEESVFHKAQLLKADYIDNGRTSIQTIWEKYAPQEAENDPKGLNKGWGPGVLKYFNEILAIQKNLDKN